MKYAIPLPVFVIALLAGQLSCYAQPQPPIPQPPFQENGGNVVTPNDYQSLNSNSNLSLVPSKNSLRKYSPIRTGDAVMPEGSFNGYSQIRSIPDLGAPGSAGSGYHHFPGPLDKYTSWYRPRAATLTQFQRCAPEPFRPRGFGNLFARPCDGFRMEYEPYSIGDENSKYGPSYPARMPDPRCDHHCHKCGLFGNACHCQ